MTKTQLLTAIKNKLIAQTWTGSSNVVFPSGSVVVSKAIAKSSLGSMGTPIAQIIPGGGKADPQYDEDPNLLIFPVTVRLITIAPGDAVGENPLMGANRASSTLSEGAGLYDLEQELYNAIGKLNTQDGIVIQFRNQGDSGAEYIDDNLYLAYEDHNFEAICTVSSSSSASTSGSLVQLSNQTATTAVLANMTNLVFPVTAGTTYQFSFYILFSTSSTTVGLSLALTYPSATNFGASVLMPLGTDGVSRVWYGVITSSGDTVTLPNMDVSGTVLVATIEGVINPSSSGNVQVQFAAETTGATITVYAGSSGIYRAMA